MQVPVRADASMKVPPKRKGNISTSGEPTSEGGLNESPSEKEGKFEDLEAAGTPSFGRLNESPSEKEGKFFRDALKDEYNPKPQ